MSKIGFQGMGEGEGEIVDAVHSEDDGGVRADVTAENEYVILDDMAV